ncbi:MAG: potassium/proton antiporter [Pegethrix bostrychoides GSE-TBD4-15B]|jgi:cell volume regulation protein A|uniref:Potassium/proton antiporter n=1 Tax=Pegethrix bostrychoides GSE-TBD4-15B TaxID=2839662 RepID=A0A951P8Z2_9CYAN|nr:potassium/proton antiporter [Pegethrix bostrychoides GSE-TBD4-15B]
MPAIEVICLVGAAFLLVSIFASKLSNRVGVPALLFFLLIGWLGGHLGGLELTNPEIAKFVGDFALIFILFTGGLDTRWSQIRPVLWQGLSLATIGVLTTMLLLGGFAWFVLGSFDSFMIGIEGISLPSALLLGAIVSSTDAAAVFSVLRSNQTQLKGNLQPLLELESSSNDPMAVLLTATIINLIAGQQTSIWQTGLTLILSLLIGTAMGYGLGRLSVWLLNRLNLSSPGLYPVATIALVLFTYSSSTLLGGNGFLAVYLAGLVLGNYAFEHQETVAGFHEGFAWLMQIVMFLTLGMLSVPFDADLLPLTAVAVVISLFLMLVARPISVLISLSWTDLPLREKLFISWVGLRGSVPIVLATFPLAVGMTQAGEIFRVVSLIVIMSVLVQGFSLAPLARRIGLAVESGEVVGEG